MIISQTACTTGKIVSKEVLAPVDELLDDILQCAREKAHSGVYYFLYNVFKQVLLGLLCQNVTITSLDRRISTYAWA